MNKTTKTKKATNGTVTVKTSSAPSPKAVSATAPAKAEIIATPSAKLASPAPVAGAFQPIATNSASTASSTPVSRPTPPAASASSPARALVPEASPKPKAKISLELINPAAKSVAVAGSFNGWNPSRTPLKLAGEGKWVGELTGISGRHEYLFVVDGQWLPDPKAKESVQNPFGGRNSVLVVPGN